MSDEYAELIPTYMQIQFVLVNLNVIWADFYFANEFKLIIKQY